MRNNMNWIKKYYPTLSISILILAFLELGARFIFSEIPRYNGGYTDEILGQIYGKEKIEDYKIVRREQSLRWQYYPFVEYKETPRSGKYVSVSSENTRCNSNGNNQCEIANGKGVIWIFGGSTVFGYGVKNDETIPAYINKIFPDYTVVNMGHGSYYSTSERILFNEKLSEGLVPEIAVFVDGLNDFYYFNIPNISGASKKIRKYLNRTSSGINLDFKFLNKSYFWMYLHSSLKPKLKKIISDPEGNGSSSLAQPDSILLKVIDRLRFNFLARQSIGDINGVKVLNVLQPVPGYGIGHKTSKVPTHLLRLEGHVNSARGYQLIEEEKFNLSVSYLDLSSLSIDEPMYIDTVHYSPEFNKQIAERISDMINNSFIEK